MTINNMATSQLQNTMIRLSTGQRINSARDDAAGLAISERMTAQIRGLDQGTHNVMDMQSLVNTAEGGLNTMGENLLRIRELTLQATNGIMTSFDRQLIQDEINELIQEIDSVAQRTEFNTMRLLDGSFSEEDGRGLHVSGDAQGRGPTVHIGNFSAGMLLNPPGSDPVSFNVVPDGFDFQAILGRVDDALARVTRERSYLGAMYNRFDHTIAGNQITSLNLAAARSRVRDADMALEVMRLHHEQIGRAHV